MISVFVTEASKVQIPCMHLSSLFITVKHGLHLFCFCAGVVCLEPDAAALDIRTNICEFFLFRGGSALHRKRPRLAHIPRTLNKDSDQSERGRVNGTSVGDVY